MIKKVTHAIGFCRQEVLTVAMISLEFCLDIHTNMMYASSVVCFREHSDNAFVIIRCRSDTKTKFSTSPIGSFSFMIKYIQESLFSESTAPNATRYNCLFVSWAITANIVPP
ncbi:hypothetical protein PanWU01x14_131510 [Parasponia andersonii]|uniref:Uncharacterized protein n=1 Tax=Parasponia andersonii TaxID=3476 RepID=A0A2P5CR06_PARAD|nr:hypothetical protein PanWU01x14_131510 [Parasponia andersonii]